MVDIDTIDREIRDFLIDYKMNVVDLNWVYGTDKNGTTLYIMFSGKGKPVPITDEFHKGIRSIRDKYGIDIKMSNS